MKGSVGRLLADYHLDAHTRHSAQDPVGNSKCVSRRVLQNLEAVLAGSDEPVICAIAGTFRARLQDLCFDLLPTR